MITRAVFPWEKEFKSKSERWSRHFCAAVVQPQGCFKHNKCRAYSDVKSPSSPLPGVMWRAEQDSAPGPVGFHMRLQHKTSGEHQP